MPDESLVTIAETVPPLSQSKHALMACPHLYYTQVVQGHALPASDPAIRGSEIHQVLAAYIRHLVEARQATDLAKFDELAAACGPDASDILDGVRDTLRIDPEKVLDTELYLSCDERFAPIAIDPEVAPAYEGTLDLVLLHSEREAEIQDWKSYYQIIEPDTFQAMLYPLLLFCHNPQLDRVVFRLEFVRYGVGREIAWARGDVPKMMRRAAAARARQLELHQLDLPDYTSPTEALEAGIILPQARPGAHCLYCPLLRVQKCPMGEFNPYGLGVEDRLRWQLYLDKAAKENLEILKQHASLHGPVEVTDDAGARYCAEFTLSRSTHYPLLPTLEVLTAHAKASGEDVTGKLQVGATALNSLARAKKRAALKEALEQVAEVEEKTRFRVGKAGNGEEDGDA